MAVQNLPVRFAIDRAGYVGADGPTHAGNYDIAYLGAIPNMVVMAAADEAELRHMVATAAAHDTGPIAFRYPRGDGVGVEMPEHGAILPIGKGRIVKQGSGVALLSFGTRLGEALAAAEKLAAYGLTPTVADARFLKPLDEELVARLAHDHDVLVTIEESGIGGFGSHVADLPRRQRPARRQAQIPPADDPRQLHRAGEPGRHVRRRRPRPRRHRQDRARRRSASPHANSALALYTQASTAPPPASLARPRAAP